MDKWEIYIPDHLSVWELTSKEWLYQVTIDYQNNQGLQEKRVFETYDHRIEEVLKNNFTLVLTILEVSKIDDMASINWIDWRLKTNNANDNNSRYPINKNPQKISVKNTSITLEIEIRTWLSVWLNRGNFLPPVTIFHNWKSGSFSLSQSMKRYPFSLWKHSLQIFWKDSRGNILAKLWWVDWVVTGDITSIINLD